MKDIWKEIDEWLQQNAPEALAALRKGASPQALDDLERQLGFPLPARFREHLAVHDGQPRGPIGLLDGWSFQGTESIGKTHQTYGKLLRAGDWKNNETSNRDGKVKEAWWSERWIPFLVGPAGDHLCFDMDPTEHGRPGQIITFWHADGDRNVRAARLEDLLAEFRDDLKAGHYQITEDGGLWPA